MSLTLDSAELSALLGSTCSFSSPRETLALTVLFHPDPALLGARAEWAPEQWRQGCLIGRRQPFLTAAEEPWDQARVLGDQHISRAVLSVRCTGDGWHLARRSAGNRIQVNGRVLGDSMALSEQQLRAGVRLRIAHRVLLLLRLGVSAGGISAPLPGLLGSSPLMSLLRDQVRRVAATDSDVLLLGETGTGKERVAHAIHQLSERRNAPLLAINLAVVPPELAALELFGARRGAYTGAHRDAQGYFSHAEGGTLFLDEVGDAPAALQPQLLRALEQREIQVLGGETRRVDVRVLSATDAAIGAPDSGFRAALRHRLGAMEIELPSLAERPEDMGILCMHYLQRGFAVAGRSQVLRNLVTQPVLMARCISLIELLLCYHWPGNVRELVNVCLQFAVQCDDKLEGAHGVLPRLQNTDGAAFPDSGAAEAAPLPAFRRAACAANSALHALSSEQFVALLAAHDHSASRVAAVLGVNRQAVYRRINNTPGWHTAVSVPLADIQMALNAAGGDIAAAARALRVSASGLRTRIRREQRAGDAAPPRGGAAGEAARYG